MAPHGGPEMEHDDAEVLLYEECDFCAGLFPRDCIGKHVTLGHEYENSSQPLNSRRRIFACTDVTDQVYADDKQKLKQQIKELFDDEEDSDGDDKLSDVECEDEREKLKQQISEALGGEDGQFSEADENSDLDPESDDDLQQPSTSNTRVHNGVTQSHSIRQNRESQSPIDEPMDDSDGSIASCSGVPSDASSNNSNGGHASQQLRRSVSKSAERSVTGTTSDKPKLLSDDALTKILAAKPTVPTDPQQPVRRSGRAHKTQPTTPGDLGLWWLSEQEPKQDSESEYEPGNSTDSGDSADEKSKKAKRARKLQRLKDDPSWTPQLCLKSGGKLGESCQLAPDVKKQFIKNVSGNVTRKKNYYPKKKYYYPKRESEAQKAAKEAKQQKREYRKQQEQMKLEFRLAMAEKQKRDLVTKTKEEWRQSLVIGESPEQREDRLAAKRAARKRAKLRALNAGVNETTMQVSPTQNGVKLPEHVSNYPTIPACFNTRVIQELQNGESKQRELHLINDCTSLEEITKWKDEYVALTGVQWLQEDTKVRPDSTSAFTVAYHCKGRSNCSARIQFSIKNWGVCKVIEYGQHNHQIRTLVKNSQTASNGSDVQPSLANLIDLKKCTQTPTLPPGKQLLVKR